MNNSDKVGVAYHISNHGHRSSTTPSYQKVNVLNIIYIEKFATLNNLFYILFKMSRNS